MKVINLFAGPGAGKSTLAAGLFYNMKSLGYRAELVTEVAKDYTYERAGVKLNNQLYMLAKQEHRLRRIADQVDYAVNDSPLLLGLAYGSAEIPWLAEAVKGAFHQYDNVNFFVDRCSHEYQEYGRNQSAAEAAQLDAAILNILNECDEWFTCVRPDALGITSILQRISFH